jgi:phosphoserine aminotransferase
VSTDFPVLPENLRPSDGRFGCGPSKVRPDALARMAATGTSYFGTSHRQAGVKSVVRRAREGVAALFDLPDGYEVVLGLGGATAVWDALACSLVEQQSRHLVVGEFSAKCAAAIRAALHLTDPEVLETPPGDTPARFEATGPDAYCYPHNETSTGVSIDVHRPAGDGLVVVDATSAAGGLRVRAEDFDVYYFSPQKCFAADAGIWLACCSPAAIERIERVAKSSDRWIPATLDLSVALENSRADQTYNTPPLAAIWLLADQVDWILANGGLPWATRRCDRSAATIYDWADAHEQAQPYVADPAARSHVTATIDFTDSVDAKRLAAALRANGIVDTEPYRKLGRNQLRVGLFPAVEPDDVAVLTRAIDWLLERI